MQDMPVDLSSFLNSMFKTQEVVMAQTIVATTDAKYLKNNTKMVTNMVDVTVELLAELEEIADAMETRH